MTIAVIDLEKKHPGASAAALRGLSFSVPAGKVASVLGRSGAGKSTLLRCLVGLDRFDRGRVEIDGVVVEANASNALLSLAGRVGLVFQSFELFPHLTVLDNVTLAPRLVKRSPRVEAEKRGRELLESLGLEEKASAYPEALSGGQKQRVAIARALAMDPRVLLYDEPTSALDASLKHEVVKTVRRVASLGITQILVTHDLQVAKDASDLVFVLDAGAVVEEGAASDVLGAPKHAVTKALCSSA